MNRLLEKFESTKLSDSKKQAVAWCKRRSLFDDINLIKKMRRCHYTFSECLKLGVFPNNQTGRWYVNIIEDYDNFAMAHGIDLCEGFTEISPSSVDVITAFQVGLEIALKKMLEVQSKGYHEVIKKDIIDSTKEFIRLYNIKKDISYPEIKEAEKSVKSIEQMKDLISKM